MAYLMGTDTYTCDYCGVEMKWDGEDERHGVLWECEKCGTKHFCSACFIKRFGKNAFDVMLQDMERLMCPDCYGLTLYDPRHKGGQHGERISAEGV